MEFCWGRRDEEPQGWISGEDGFRGKARWRPGILLVEQKFAAMTQSCVEGMVGGVLRAGVDQSPVLSPQQATLGAGAVQAARH